MEISHHERGAGCRTAHEMAAAWCTSRRRASTGRSAAWHTDKGSGEVNLTTARATAIRRPPQRASVIAFSVTRGTSDRRGTSDAHIWGLPRAAPLRLITAPRRQPVRARPRAPWTSFSCLRLRHARPAPNIRTSAPPRQAQATHPRSPPPHATGATQPGLRLPTRIAWPTGSCPRGTLQQVHAVGRGPRSPGGGLAANMSACARALSRHVRGRRHGKLGSSPGRWYQPPTPRRTASSRQGDTQGSSVRHHRGSCHLAGNLDSTGRLQLLAKLLDEQLSGWQGPALPPIQPHCSADE